MSLVMLAVASCAGEVEGEVEPLGDAEDEIGGANQAGTNLAGANLSGSNLGGSNVGGANLSGANLGGNNLSGNNLSGANLSGTNLAGNNLGGNNLSGNNLSGANLSGNNLSGANLSGIDLAGSNLGGHDVGGTYPGAGTPVANAVHLGAPSDATFAAAGNLIGKSIHTGITGTGMLHSREDLYTRARACVVMGLGSTAFAKLVQQNTGTMYAAVKKLPWGFSQTRGGATSLYAWEVVIWGGTSYCVFILASPTGASYEGVTGFIKAVWRWNAPTTRTLKIGQIDGGKAIQSYPGMMNTAARAINGTIKQKYWVAGLLAFITATTNNLGVNADFAATTIDKNFQPIVLGNVAGAPGWAEGQFVAYEEPDGSIRIGFDHDSRPTASSPETMRELRESYERWQDGAGPKPVAKRCGGAMVLNRIFNEPIPSGKCDSGIVYLNAPSDFRVHFGETWSLSPAVSPKVLPHNGYMYLEPDGPAGKTAPVRKVQRVSNGAIVGSVVASIFMHLNERSY